MTEKRKTAFEKPSESEMMFTRIFDAARAIVWQAWTDPARLAKWWGPSGFSITTHEMRFKEGGFWKLTMHGPDGRDYKNKIAYLEINEPERIVYKHAGEEGDECVHFQTTVTFESLDENITKLTMLARFDTPEALKFVVDNYGADKGGVQTLDRLAEYIEAEKSSPDSWHLFNTNSMGWQVVNNDQKIKNSKSHEGTSLCCRRFPRVLSVPSTYTKNSSASMYLKVVS